MRNFLVSGWLVFGLSLTLLPQRAVGQLKHVLYGDEIGRYATHPRPSIDAARIYFDMEGSLYPPYESQIVIDNGLLKGYEGSLQDYFTGQAGPYTLLRKYYNLPPAAADTKDTEIQADRRADRTWSETQLAAQDRFNQAFNQGLQADGTTALVVLVHGFNNKVEEVDWYDTVEKRLLTDPAYFKGKKVRFLEVRWDGGTGGLTRLKLWQRAQATMYFVGLGLRRLLSSLPPTLPVYVLGHSTGAPITCVALWNSTAALSEPYPSLWGEPYNQSLLRRPEYKTPQLQHLRVAFVAPAMPADHFDDYFERTPAVAPAQVLRYERLVIGQNQHDFVTSKAGINPGLSGYTTLGYQPEAFCTGVVPKLAAFGNGTPAYRVDFTQEMTDIKQRTQHGIKYFLRTPTKAKCLLDLWLTDAPPTCADACR